MTPDPLDGFDAYVAQAVGAWDVPGLGIVVVEDGRVVFEQGYGVRRLGEAGQVDPFTLFGLASMSKAFTVAALGILVDEGRVAWDERLADILPWFRLKDPWLTRELTLRDVLTHRSGLVVPDSVWLGRDAAPRSLLEGLASVDVGFSPRSSFRYNNLTFAAAGEVVAAVSGMPWADFVRTRLLDPLGLRRTATSLAGAMGRGNVACPHARVDGRTEPIERQSFAPVEAAGAMWASVGDMGRWLRFLLAGGVTESGTRLLQEDTVAEMFTPQAIVPPHEFPDTHRLTRPRWMTYGLGWFQEDYEGLKVDFHTGSIDGMCGVAALVRDCGLGVCVLSNGRHIGLCRALVFRALDAALGFEARDWGPDMMDLYDAVEAEHGEPQRRRVEERVSGTAPSLPLSAYVGRYAHSLSGSLIVTEAPAGLRADWGPGRTGTLTHWHLDTFRLDLDARWLGWRLVTFSVGVTGRVELAVIDGEGWLTREPSVPVALHG